MTAFIVSIDIATFWAVWRSHQSHHKTTSIHIFFGQFCAFLSTSNQAKLLRFKQSNELTFHEAMKLWTYTSPSNDHLLPLCLLKVTGTSSPSRTTIKSPSYVVVGPMP